MKNLLNKLYIFILVILVLAGCAEQPVRQQLFKSMVELDRAYIPALIFTGLHRQRESELALERLQNNWHKFNDRFYGLELKYGQDITDKYWQSDFDRVSALITAAEVLIKAGSLEAAEQELAGVRVVLSELRARNGMKYFLDGLTGFDNCKDDLIAALKGKDKLSDKDVLKLRALFKNTQACWTKVSQAQLDPELFGFDEKKIAAVKKRVQEEERLLAALAVDLSSNDPDRIFQSVQELSPNFMVLYKAFGDFQPIFDQVIKERKKKESEVKP